MKKFKNGDLVRNSLNNVEKVIIKARKKSYLWFYPYNEPKTTDELISNIYDSRNSSDKELLTYEKVGCYDITEVKKLLNMYERSMLGDTKR